MSGPDAKVAVAGDDMLAELRDLDRDRYLACLLAPAGHRADLAALYAFNAEIARLRDVVREPMAGEIRLQWWRDAIDGPEGTRTGHPIADALRAAIARHALPLPALHAMIDARVFDLYDDPMGNRATFEAYAGETASALIQLACLILDPKGAGASSDAAGHGGVAQAIAGALLLLPQHRARGQVFLPADLLEAIGLDRDRLLAADDPSAIDTAIRAFVALGRDHLAASRRSAGTVSAANRAAFAVLGPIAHVLDRAEKAGHRLLTESPLPSQWRRQWWMWRTARSGRW
ncbi:phytoene/squalene synthase family protein [Rhizobium sp. SG2393]|uniref:phytoene/squalene synthase family protein n=1 Tax=Rhizobium sp. SG2393 TaxID=3276279 RepID=UPI00366F1086